ncbi:unnamed protein product [Moneuplotes crassus]|uniref:Uncharacterized protein n=1 Tax=Euplotes crassus TaxID=5936 RepID=A0AAD1XP66_EUPCR|nr:unnamed protein product [Moneuplotes crassus]
MNTYRSERLLLSPNPKRIGSSFVEFESEVNKIKENGKKFIQNIRKRSYISPQASRNNPFLMPRKNRNLAQRTFIEREPAKPPVIKKTPSFLEPGNFFLTGKYKKLIHKTIYQRFSNRPSGKNLTVTNRTGEARSISRIKRDISDKIEEIVNSREKQEILKRSIKDIKRNKIVQNERSTGTSRVWNLNALMSPFKPPRKQYYTRNSTERIKRATKKKKELDLRKRLQMILLSKRWVIHRKARKYNSSLNSSRQRNNSDLKTGPSC